MPIIERDCVERKLVREESVKRWMKGKGLADSTIATQLSKMRKIDRHFGDLDELIESGKIDRVVDRLNDPASLPSELGNEGERNHLRQSLRYYLSFAEADRSGAPASPFEELKSRFLKRFPDFESAGGFPGQSSYTAEEDSYKRALIARAEEIRGELANDPEKLGGRLLDLIGDDTDLESNLLGWRMADGLRKRRQQHPGLLETAAARVAMADDVVEAVIQFVSDTWETAFANEKNNPYTDSRLIPTAIGALLHPERMIALRTDRFNALSRITSGGQLFGWNPLSEAQLDRALDLVDQLFVVMRDKWGWRPRDLWDVQGFIWVACGKTDKSKKDLDPTPVWLVTSLWGQEDGLPRFIERDEWSLLTDTGSDNNRRVREMRVGDHIFLKDFVPKATDLPFDANGGIVTANRFRARGTIVQESDDGLRVGVEWEEFDEPRSWYFFTSPLAVWRLLDPGEKPSADRLRRFLLEDEPQDFEWFLNDPFWRNRLFGPVDKETTNMTQPVNLILYGPPGTGKTYHTAEEAVRLCDGSVPETREELKARYRQLVDEERIGFVTFHQNFSYEDFVEGLRPSQVDEDGNLLDSGFLLSPEPGIFRQMAERAETLQASRSDGYSLEGKRFFKFSLGEVANPDDDYLFDEAIEGGFVHLGDDSGIDWSERGYDTKAQMIDAYAEAHPNEPRLHPNAGAIDHPYQMRNRFREGDLILVSKGNLLLRAIGEITGPYHEVERDNDDYTDRVAVRWLWIDRDGVSYDVVNRKRFSQKTIYELASSHLKLEALRSLIDTADQAGTAAKGEAKQFVLVIDEINRANISKVFGELITLIEPDKRLGMEEELTVTLPYSKREFGVPANLHIIGTMNTADRSIALLDTALRRRFRFKEMPPQADLLADAEAASGVPLTSLLSAMNDRIEYLVDREHRIGHAFFMGCRDREDVDQVMRDKVIPLLQEYFFDDWGRIKAVLGSGFIGERTLSPPPGFDGMESKSWFVRDEFPVDAYESLVVGAEPGGGYSFENDEDPEAPQ